MTYREVTDALRLAGFVPGLAETNMRDPERAMSEMWLSKGHYMLLQSTNAPENLGGRVAHFTEPTPTRLFFGRLIKAEDGTIYLVGSFRNDTKGQDLTDIGQDTTAILEALARQDCKEKENVVLFGVATDAGAAQQRDELLELLKVGNEIALHSHKLGEGTMGAWLFDVRAAIAKAERRDT